jgi:hypothetical protein
MKQYPHFPTEVSALSFSPDGEKLAIGVSYEHDNGVAKAEEMGRTALLIKTTVMDDCRVSSSLVFFCLIEMAMSLATGADISTLFPVRSQRPRQLEL